MLSLKSKRWQLCGFYQISWNYDRWKHNLNWWNDAYEMAYKSFHLVKVVEERLLVRVITLEIFWNYDRWKTNFKLMKWFSWRGLERTIGSKLSDDSLQELLLLKEKQWNRWAIHAPQRLQLYKIYSIRLFRTPYLFRILITVITWLFACKSYSFDKIVYGVKKKWIKRFNILRSS